MSVPSLARKLAVSVLSFLVILLLGELAARWAEPGPFNLYDVTPYSPWGKSHVHKANFEGRWDGSWYETNRRGWRGPEFEPTFGPEEFRVIAVGDSCTFGKGVREEDCWPRQLESMLKAEMGPGVQPVVGNMGVNGYSSMHYLQVLKNDGLEVKPDLVVLGYNLNDFPNIAQKVDHAVFQQKKLRSSIPYDLRGQLGRLALFRLMRSIYYDMNREADWANAERMARTAPEEASGSSPRMEREAEILGEIVRLSREAGAEVAIFLFPYESMVYLDSYSTGPVDNVRALAARLEVDFIDMVETFRDVANESDPPLSLFIRGDRYHPNERGYQIVARHVADLVRERGWGPTRD